MDETLCNNENCKSKNFCLRYFLHKTEKLSRSRQSMIAYDGQEPCKEFEDLEFEYVIDTYRLIKREEKRLKSIADYLRPLVQKAIDVLGDKAGYQSDVTFSYNYATPENMEYIHENSLGKLLLDVISDSKMKKLVEQKLLDEKHYHFIRLNREELEGKGVTRIKKISKS